MASVSPTLFAVSDAPPVNTRQPRSHQASLGQFFTPPPLARFMADLFSTPAGPVRLLNAGAGDGALTSAFVERWQASAPINADAYELDPLVLPALRQRLAALSSGSVSAQAIAGDFLAAAATAIRLGRGLRYTHAILNPPYRKIGTTSPERRLAAAVGLDTVNLYSAFVGLALDLMAPGGELVVIIPRSFCNGPYYRPFRRWLLARASLTRLHLFGSRRDAFAQDQVLQENVILVLRRGAPQRAVVVSTSTGTDLADLASNTQPFDALVHAHDPDQIIAIPTTPVTATGTAPGVGHTLADLGLTVATGPVVDFRLRDELRNQPGPETAPLLFAHHLKQGEVTWPVMGRKPNAIQRNEVTAKWLVPNGWYVLVKRFSSKEERRRVVAALCDPGQLPGELLGLDNKLNLIRAGKQPLPEAVARGLTVVLNSSAVDQAFRRFSGHTQVNAADLRRLLFPDLTQLAEIGRRVSDAMPTEQSAIDACVAAVLQIGAERTS